MGESKKLDVLSRIAGVVIGEVCRGLVTGFGLNAWLRKFASDNSEFIGIFFALLERFELPAGAIFALTIVIFAMRQPCIANRLTKCQCNFKLLGVQFGKATARE